MRPDLDSLADPTRRTMLALLAVEQELCVCELEAALDLIQPVVSRQLAILREAGWLEANREGRRIYYRIGDVPRWARLLVDAYLAGGVPPADLETARQRLNAFAGRPIRLTRAAS
jgi:DNA-binding transcriptional ArsR family regulator